jgi:hypothetical protein
MSTCIDESRVGWCQIGRETGPALARSGRPTRAVDDRWNRRVITEGFLVRHYQGAAGARDAALLDVAQDHLLSHLSTEGLFDRGLVSKGGTALRKVPCRRPRPVLN